MDKVISQIANVLEDIWIFCNVYPITHKAIIAKVSKYITDIDTLKRTPKSRLTSNCYMKKVNQLEMDVQNGFDIKKSEGRIKESTKFMS